MLLSSTQRQSVDAHTIYDHGMRIWTQLTGNGVAIGIGDAPTALAPSPTANQTSPRRYYVYAHRRTDGVPFYIGKGIGRRAWSTERHPLWHRYVDQHLMGAYAVLILADDLEARDAEELEGQWIGQEARTLVNWQSFGRGFDYAALERYHSLRDANRSFVAETRTLEEDRREEAINRYMVALVNLEAYATMPTENGLVGQLLEEEARELGRSGDLTILDRLTLCLVKAQRASEARDAATHYLERYRRDVSSPTAERIRKRIAKASAR